MLTIGGYKSRDPFPTVVELKSMVAAGEILYVFLSDHAGSTSAARASGESSTGTRETLRVLIEWITENGTPVGADQYSGSSEGTLYLLGS